MSAFFLPAEKLPSGFAYPLSYRLLIERGLLNWEPWELLRGASLAARYDGVRQRYPRRLLVPFARRGDRDDVACWDLDRSPGTISTIEDFAPAGDEQTGWLESLGDWVRLAVNDMVEFAE